MLENEPPLLPGRPEETNALEPTTVPTPPDLPGDNVEDREPIPDLIGAAEAVLRQPHRIFNRIGESDGRRLAFHLVILSMLGLLGYGLVVGTFSGGQQFWAAPLKVAGGILASGLICLPSLYIFSCLAGSRASLQQVMGLVAGLTAIMTFLLVGFAPVAWIFSQSTNSIPMMGFLHLAFWSVSMYFAVAFFKAGFETLVTNRENSILGIWVTVFVIVVLQMSTALCPIIGSGDSFLPQEKKFFVGHWADNFTGRNRTTP